MSQRAPSYICGVLALPLANRYVLAKYSLCILVKQFQCSVVIHYQDKLLVLRSCHYLLIQNVDHSNPLRCCAVLTQLLCSNNKQADALENPEFPFQQTERSLYRRFFKSMCFIESSLMFIMVQQMVSLISFLGYIQCHLK